LISHNNYKKVINNKTVLDHKNKLILSLILAVLSLNSLKQLYSLYKIKNSL